MTLIPKVLHSPLKCVKQQTKNICNWNTKQFPSANAEHGGSVEMEHHGILVAPALVQNHFQFPSPNNSTDPALMNESLDNHALKKTHLQNDEPAIVKPSPVTKAMKGHHHSAKVTHFVKPKLASKQTDGWPMCDVNNPAPSTSWPRQNKASSMVSLQFGTTEHATPFPCGD